MPAKIVFVILAAILAIANGEYSYSYEVADPKTGAVKSHREARIAGRVSGQYSVSEPQSKRTAQYSIGGPLDINGYLGLVGANGYNGHTAPLNRPGFTNPLGHPEYGALGNPVYAATGAFGHEYGAPLGGFGYVEHYRDPAFAAPFADPGYSGSLANLALGNSVWPNPAVAHPGFSNPLVNGYASPVKNGGYRSQLPSPYSTLGTRDILGLGGRQGW